jgi:hypothetical protein
MAERRPSMPNPRDPVGHALDDAICDPHGVPDDDESDP